MPSGYRRSFQLDFRQCCHRSHHLCPLSERGLGPQDHYTLSPESKLDWSFPYDLHSIPCVHFSTHGQSSRSCREDCPAPFSASHPCDLDRCSGVLSPGFWRDKLAGISSLSHVVILAFRYCTRHIWPFRQ
jgi:hypothetical protein